MPVYLVHGFRWPRDGYSGIRVHAIVHNLEDCSVEYIQNEHSREEILGSFRKAYADIMKDLEAGGKSLEFIEQYDPEDTESSNVVSQPHAFVADKVVELAGQSIAQPSHQSQKDNSGPSASLLSVNVEEVIANGPGLTPQAWEAMADLRDKIAAGEKIGWWVVYNGDPARAYESEDEDEYEEASTPTAESVPATKAALETVALPASSQAGPPVPPKSTVLGASPSGSKTLPSRGKQEVVKPEAVLPTPTDEKIPAPPKLKEAAKSSGFRKKFFGKKI